MLIYRKFLLFLGLSLVSVSLLKAMELESSTENRDERNWRNSLNLHYGDNVFEVDRWFSDTKDSISEQNTRSILKSIKERPRYLPNVATGRFVILYKDNNNPTLIKYALWDLQKFFLSGQFDASSNAQVITARLFTDKGELNTSQFNSERMRRINELFGCDLKSGTCSEASILEYIYHHLAHLLDKISEHETHNPWEIIGTILQVSSLKDPCSENCIPMLQSYMENIRKILMQHLPNKEITVAHILENIVLLAGQKAYISSRHDLEENREPIRVDLDNPKNRIFSRKND